MLQRFLKLFDVFNSVLSKNSKASPMVNVMECTIIVDVIPILQMFDTVTVAVSSETFVTASK